MQLSQQSPWNRNQEGAFHIHEQDICHPYQPDLPPAHPLNVAGHCRLAGQNSWPTGFQRFDGPGAGWRLVVPDMPARWKCPGRHTGEGWSCSSADPRNHLTFCL